MYTLLSAGAAIGLLGMIPSSIAHSVVDGVNIDGKYWQGYSPSFANQPSAPKVFGWSIPKDQDLGFVSPHDYTSANIACHTEATPAPLTASAQAGASITFDWRKWVSSHKGPVLTYLANCNGPCESVDVMSLEFFKFQEEGYDGGEWAADKLLANNASWTVQLPKDIAAGNYVLRHEIIALHEANRADGTQNYPQCFNLKIEGSGTANPKGVKATELYTDASVMYDLYKSPLDPYKIPGPPLYSGGTGGGSSDTAGASMGSATGNASGSSSSQDNKVVKNKAEPNGDGGSKVDQHEDDGYDDCEL